MFGGNLRDVVANLGIVLLVASAGCTTSLGSTNDAGVTLENEDDTAHEVQITVNVENETVLSRTSSIGPGDGRMLDDSEVSVTGSERQYRVRVSLENGRTETTSFAASEFDSIKITLTSEGHVTAGYVNAA